MVVSTNQLGSTLTYLSVIENIMAIHMTIIFTTYRNHNIRLRSYFVDRANKTHTNNNIDESFHL